jgi:hypothetical protein
MMEQGKLHVTYPSPPCLVAIPHKWITPCQM